ncbi:YSIRK-type signal peptide-containing protein, partial [Streptococcus ovuberis]
MQQNKTFNNNQTKELRFSIRKFKAGVASIAIAAFWIFGGASASAEEIATQGESSQYSTLVTAREADREATFNYVIEYRDTNGQLIASEEKSVQVTTAEDIASITITETAKESESYDVISARNQTKDLKEGEVGYFVFTVSNAKPLVGNDKAEETDTSIEFAEAKPVQGQKAISYKVQYVDINTGLLVATSPAKVATADVYDGEVPRATVTEVAELPSGYQLAEGQAETITQDVIYGQRSSKLLTFSVTKSDAQVNLPEGASFRATVDNSKYLQGEVTYTLNEADSVRGGKNDTKTMGDVVVRTKENTDGTFEMVITTTTKAGSKSDVRDQHIGYALYNGNSLITPTTVTANGSPVNSTGTDVLAKTWGGTGDSTQAVVYSAPLTPSKEIRWEAIYKGLTPADYSLKMATVSVAQGATATTLGYDAVERSNYDGRVSYSGGSRFGKTVTIPLKRSLPFVQPTTYVAWNGDAIHQVLEKAEGRQPTNLVFVQSEGGQSYPGRSTTNSESYLTPSVDSTGVPHVDGLLAHSGPATWSTYYAENYNSTITPNTSRYYVLNADNSAVINVPEGEKLTRSMINQAVLAMLERVNASVVSDKNNPEAYKALDYLIAQPDEQSTWPTSGRDKKINVTVKTHSDYETVKDLLENAELTETQRADLTAYFKNLTPQSVHRREVTVTINFPEQPPRVDLAKPYVFWVNNNDKIDQTLNVDADTTIKEAYFSTSTGARQGLDGLVMTLENDKVKIRGTLAQGRTEPGEWSREVTVVDDANRKTSTTDKSAYVGLVAADSVIDIKNVTKGEASVTEERILANAKATVRSGADAVNIYHFNKETDVVAKLAEGQTLPISGVDNKVLVNLTTKDGHTKQVIVTVNYELDQTTAEKTTPKAPAKTPVSDLNKLTEDEKAKVADAVKKANPDFPERTTVEVGNDGTVTVTYPDQSTDTIPADQTVEKKVPITDGFTPKDPVKTVVSDKTKLTEEEKGKVSEAVKKANPDFPERTTVEVGNDGAVTVTYPDQSTDTIPADRTVVGKPITDEINPKAPAKTPVSDLNKLTEDEKAKVADAVKASNPTFPNNTDVTVD